MGNGYYDTMRLKSIIASRLRVNQAYIKNVCLVGRGLENACVVDLSGAKVTDYDGAVWARTGTHWLSVPAMVADREWAQQDMMNIVLARRTAYI